MDRRTFFQIGAAGALCWPEFERLLPAAERPARAGATSKLPELLERALTPRAGIFPTVQPVFGGIFTPGGSQAKTITANGFAAFSSQVQAQAAAGFVVTSLTAIRSLGSTFYYAALKPGSGAYQLARTTDPNQFQQTFTANKSGYRLVDFSVTWEQGLIAYTGYWLAVSAAANQSLITATNFSNLAAQWTSLSNNGMRMTRVQSYPLKDDSAFVSLFEAGTGGYALYSDSIPSFPSDVANRFSTDTLVGLGYDMVYGNMIGCWRNKVANAQFVWNQDWNTLGATAQTMASNGLTLSALSAYPNTPDFDSYFAANLAPYVMGYAYAVAKNGQVVTGGYGNARSAAQPQNPSTPLLATTRMNLASVSKAVTGVALEVMCMQKGISLDTPFWPLIKSMVPNPDNSVKPVTLRNLATMKSGMQTPNNEGPLGGNLWNYINTYLAMPLTGTPGVTYSYNNENFTILRGVMEQVTGQDYVSWVTQNVLQPAGINTSIFSDAPDPQATATLMYNGPSDARTGGYWTQADLDFVAPGGWVSSAAELVKLLMALRGASVLPQTTVSEMFTDGVGWFTFDGNFGTYYQKNGGLSNGANPPQQLNTCVVRFTEGYDLALVANSDAPADVVPICCQAFDSRGLLTTDAPPAIASVFHAASFGSKAAPGAYVSIKGSGFTDQTATDWSSSIKANALPTSVGGISVAINGQSAYVQYISNAQVNFLLPGNAPTGIVDVDLLTPTGVMTTTLEIDAVAPGLFAYALNGVLYPAAVYGGIPSVVYVAPAGALPGYSSHGANAGDVIELYATGCGSTNPTAPNGVVLTQVYPAANLAQFRVTIAGISAPVQFAGIVGSGLWQINIQVPSALPAGDQPLVLTVNGIATQSGLVMHIGA